MPTDPGGRSGIFPRIDPNAPPPTQADTPGPRRPAPVERDRLDSDSLFIPESEDLARYDDDTDPEDSDPGA
jgi:hypothetical protein